MRFKLPNVLLFLFQAFILNAQTPQVTLDSIWSEFIRKYKDIAMDEMERSGIPASIKLAQGILESRAGTSELALKANNHFGIKCGKNWRGNTYYKNDDERDKKGEPVHSCFRKYDSVVECFADHSDFIRNPEKRHRYGFLFQLDPRDYKGWAQGLQDAGYSSVDYYAEKLIYFIERFRLFEYDALAYNGRIALKRLAEINGVKMVQARPGETLSEIARMYNLPVEKLEEYNDYGYAPDAPLSVGAWVFVQSKRQDWSGRTLFHEVAPEQRLFDISQLYGIRLDALQARNGLRAGEEPASGARLRLQGRQIAAKSVQLRSLEELLAPELTISGESGETASNSGYTIEMLPEEPLQTPVPTYWPAIGEQTADTTDQNTKPDVPMNDAQPLIILNTATGETEIYHTVSKGETLYSIARKYDISTARLRRINHLQDNILKIGQTLRVN